MPLTIDDLIVEKSFQRQGIGQRLLLWGMNHIKEQGYEEIILHVAEWSMYAAGNLDDGLKMILNPIIPHWVGGKLVSLPIDSKEIRLADGQAVYIEGYNIFLI